MHIPVTGSHESPVPDELDIADNPVQQLGFSFKYPVSPSFLQVSEQIGGR